MKRIIALLSILVAVTLFGAPAMASSNKNYSCSYTNAGDGPNLDYDFADRKDVSKSDVKALQTALHKAGYPSGPIDGVYGPITTKAVRGYQAKRNMDGNGKLTAETLRSLRIVSWCGYDHRLHRNYN
jgi:hypothetical protein